MNIVKNGKEILEQLLEMLMQFDKDCNGYQTDIYLYYNVENQTAELSTFQNVGGNSWLDDDHYVLYSDKEHWESKWDWYQEISEIAEALDKTKEELLTEILNSNDHYDSIDEIDYTAVKEYIQENEQYEELLQTQYEQYIDELTPEYVEKSKDILIGFEEEYDFDFDIIY